MALEEHERVTVQVKPHTSRIWQLTGDSLKRTGDPETSRKIAETKNCVRRSWPEFRLDSLGDSRYHYDRPLTDWMGHFYHGRFKSFPVQSDHPLFAVIR